MPGTPTSPTRQKYEQKCNKICLKSLKKRENRQFSAIFLFIFLPCRWGLESSKTIPQIKKNHIVRNLAVRDAPEASQTDKLGTSQGHLGHLGLIYVSNFDSKGTSNVPGTDGTYHGTLMADVSPGQTGRTARGCSARQDSLCLLFFFWFYNVYNGRGHVLGDRLPDWALEKPLLDPGSPPLQFPRHLLRARKCLAGLAYLPRCCRSTHGSCLIRGCKRDRDRQKGSALRVHLLGVDFSFPCRWGLGFQNRFPQIGFSLVIEEGELLTPTPKISALLRKRARFTKGQFRPY